MFPSIISGVVAEHSDRETGRERDSLYPEGKAFPIRCKEADALKQRHSRIRISDVATQSLSSIDWISSAEAAEKKSASLTSQPACGYMHDTVLARWLFMIVLL
jgi:hypothetical protein